MEPIFKVGDIVRIKNLAKITREIGRLPFSYGSDMQELVGKEFQIKAVYPNHYASKDYPQFTDCDGCLYYLEEDKRIWSWSSPMFEKVEPGVLRAGTETPSGTSLPTSDETSRPLKLVTKRYNVKLNFKN